MLSNPDFCVDDSRQLQQNFELVAHQLAVCWCFNGIKTSHTAVRVLFSSQSPMISPFLRK
jgi:hypothetical protein